MAKDETKLFSKSSRNLFIIAVGAGITATVLTSEWFWRLLGDSDFALWAKEKFTSDVNLHPMLFGLLLLAPFFVAWILWPKSNFSGGSTPAKGATVEVRGGDASTVMDLDALSENERVVIEYMASGDRTPVFEPRVMWEIEHIRLLPLRTQQVVSCPVNGVV